MGWSLGEDNGRDIGYGVPAFCDHPGCGAEIDRGLSYRCGELHNEVSCGMFFCPKHLSYPDVDDEAMDKVEGAMCERCCTAFEKTLRWEKRGCKGKAPKWDSFDPTPDHPLWIRHKLKDPSWAKWRKENPELVETLTEKISTTLSLDLRGWDTEESPPIGTGYADPRI